MATYQGPSVLAQIRESNAKAQSHIRAVGEILAAVQCPQEREAACSVAPSAPSVYQQLVAATTDLQELGTQMMTGMDAAEQGLATVAQQLESAALNLASAGGYLFAGLSSVRSQAPSPTPATIASATYQR